MSKASLAAIIVAVVLIGGVGFALVSAGDDETPVSANQSTASSGSSDSSSSDTATTPVKQGVFTDYSTQEVAAAKQRGDKTVLFFHATWCPTCKSLERNINSGVIPEDLTILKTNYDTETALKKKHGVTFQHTLVQIDDSGDTIKRWSGSFDVEEIVDELT